MSLRAIPPAAPLPPALARASSARRRQQQPQAQVQAGAKGETEEKQTCATGGYVSEAPSDPPLLPPPGGRTARALRSTALPPPTQEQGHGSGWIAGASFMGTSAVPASSGLTEEAHSSVSLATHADRAVSATATPAAAAASTTAPNWAAGSDANPALVGISEFEQQTFLLSRSQRQQWGLKSMREIARIMASPMVGYRDAAGAGVGAGATVGSGATSTSDYWPAEGRLARMSLRDASPTHHNDCLVDPRASVGDTYEREMREVQEQIDAATAALTAATASSSTTSPAVAAAASTAAPAGASATFPAAAWTDAPSHHTRRHEAKRNAPKHAAAAGAPSIATNQIGTEEAAAASSVGATDTPPLSSSTDTATSSPWPTDAAFLRAFALLTPDALDVRDASARAAAAAKEAADRRREEAARLLSSAQHAPFVLLRREEEVIADPLTRLMASQRPLLSDAQIDALLAAKIDASVRKGYPRSRAEMQGMRSKGTLSFGMSDAHGTIGSTAAGAHALGRSSARSHTGEDGSTLAVEFHASGAGASLVGGGAHARRQASLTLPRAYSARTSAQRAREQQVARARLHTSRVLDEPPPVGFYNPHRSVVAGATRTAAPDFDGQVGRQDSSLGGASLGLGAAELVEATQRIQMSRPSSSSVSVRRIHAGPGPSDGYVARLFDRDRTEYTRRDEPGTQFSKLGVGERSKGALSARAQQTIAHYNALGAGKGQGGKAGSWSRPASAYRPAAAADMADNAAVPSQHPKLFSSLAPASARGVSFTSASSSARQSSQDPGREGIHQHLNHARAQPPPPSLQYASNDLIGAGARSGLCATRPSTPAISIPRSARLPVDSNPLAALSSSSPASTTTAAAAASHSTTSPDGPRELMRRKQERWAAERSTRQRAHTEQASRATEAAQRKARRAEKLKRQIEERDRRMRGETQRRESGFAEPFVAGGEPKNEVGAAGEDVDASDAVTEGKPDPHGPDASSSLSPLDTDSSFSSSSSSSSPSARFDRSVRARLGPLGSWAPEARARRLAAQVALREDRAVRVAAHRARREAARREEKSGRRRRGERAAKQRAVTPTIVPQPTTNDDAVVALQNQEAQKRWVCMLVHLPRLRHWSARLLANRRLVSLQLAYLPPGVALAVLQARDSWKRLVLHRKRDVAARIVCRAVARLGALQRRRRRVAAAQVLTAFFTRLSERVHVQGTIHAFRAKVVRLQRWWRRHLPVLHARNAFLERMWTRTLLVRWEELIKYKQYLYHFMGEAAAGSFTSALGTAAGGGGEEGGAASAARVVVPLEDRQRYANLAIVWRSNEEESHATCMVPHPPLALAVTNSEGAAGAGGEPNAGSTLSSPTRSASSAGTSSSSSSTPRSDHVWERFVYALFLRGAQAAAAASGKRVRGPRMKLASVAASAIPSPLGSPHAGVSVGGGVFSSATLRNEGEGNSVWPGLLTRRSSLAVGSPPGTSIPSGGSDRIATRGPPEPLTRASSLRFPVTWSRLPSTASTFASTSSASFSACPSMPPPPLVQLCSFGGLESWNGARLGQPCERAQLEFENFLCISKQPSAKESHSMTVSVTQPGAGGGGASLSLHMSGGSRSHTAASSPLHSPRFHGLASPAPALGVCFADSVHALEPDALSLDDAQAPEVAAGTLLRRSLLRILYLRTRRAHRKLIYERRAYSSPRAQRGGGFTFEPANAAVAAPDASPAVSVAHWSALHGAASTRARRWHHLLSVPVVYALLLECMVPRGMHAQWAAGHLLGREGGGDDFARWLREHSRDKAVQLRPHAGWPLFWQKYGCQPKPQPPAEPEPPAPAPAAAALTPAAPTTSRPAASGSASARARRRTSSGGSQMSAMGPAHGRNLSTVSDASRASNSSRKAAAAAVVKLPERRTHARV